jgi:hypothetical protein
MIDLAKVETGLGLLMSHDGYLLEKDISERAITHKLAEYLQQLFLEWNVDCEFNKNLNKPKAIDIDPRQLLILMANYLEKNYAKEKTEIDDISTTEERNDLIRQLYNPEIDYIEELDLYLFLLNLGGTIIRKTIYPDIIIHHRGTSDNHIVIEAKKTKNRNREARLYDLIKLATLTSQREFHYRKGIFIDLPVGGDFSRFRAFDIRRAAFRNVFEYLPR